MTGNDKHHWKREVPIKNFNSKNKGLGDGQNLFSASTSHFIYLLDQYNVNSRLILDIVRAFNEHETRKQRCQFTGMSTEDAMEKHSPSRFLVRDSKGRFYQADELSLGVKEKLTSQKRENTVPWAVITGSPVRDVEGSRVQVGSRGGGQGGGRPSLSQFFQWNRRGG